MRQLLAVAAVGLGLGATNALAENVKVGFIMTYAGEFAEWGNQTKGGIETYQALHGDSVGGNKIEIVYKDEGGINPARAKQLATELVLRDKAKFIVGFTFSPDALAVADVITQAKVPTIITNAATGFITQKSPYFARVSFTLQQQSASLGRWAAAHGVNSVDAVIADYVAGEDSLAGFTKAYEAGGGKIVQTIKYPVTVADVTPFYERVLQDKPNSVFVFGTGAVNTKIMVGTWSTRLKPAGIGFIGPLQLTQNELNGIGDGALGVIQTTHYPERLDTPMNQTFKAAWEKVHGKGGDVPDMAAVAAFDAMEMIYRAVEKFGPGVTADQAIGLFKGMKIESPRGPIEIDPQTRDIIQNIYLERTEKVDGQLANVIIDVVKDVKDPWKEEHPE